MLMKYSCDRRIVDPVGNEPGRRQGPRAGGHAAVPQRSNSALFFRRQRKKLENCKTGRGRRKGGLRAPRAGWAGAEKLPGVGDFGALIGEHGARGEFCGAELRVEAGALVEALWVHQHMPRQVRAEDVLYDLGLVAATPAAMQPAPIVLPRQTHFT